MQISTLADREIEVGTLLRAAMQTSQQCDISQAQTVVFVRGAFVAVVCYFGLLIPLMLAHRPLPTMLALWRQNPRPHGTALERSSALLRQAGQCSSYRQL
jgi:hypothetical protein